MPRTRSALIQHIHMIAGTYKEDGRSDADLLSQYAEFHDDEAFTVLMVRHGFLVWSICRSILGNAEDAEDALQTTFMALARNATRLRVARTLAGWLQHVARRAAFDARAMAKSRQRLKSNLENFESQTRSGRPKPDELYEALHEQLAKLPEKLRAVLVLHHLEAKTQVEVARILGVTEQTVRNRLVQGKSIIEKQLSKLGLMSATAALGLLLDGLASQAAMPPGLMGKAVRTATAFRDGKLAGGLAQLANEVLKRTPAAMPWWKTGWMLTIVSLSGLGLAAGGAAWKSGFFGTKADGPPIAEKRGALQVNKVGSQNPRLDLYGDPLPPGALARLGTTRFRQGSEFQPVLFTPDSRGFVTCSIGRPACLCDAATGQVLRKFGKDVRFVALSNDGRILAGRSEDSLGAAGQGGLCLWDVATGKVLHQTNANAPIDWAAPLALSPDVKTVISTGTGSNLCAWQIATGTILWENPHPSGWHTLAYSSDGKTVLDFYNQEVHLLDALTGKKLRRWGKRENREVVSCAFSQDAHLAAVVYIPVAKKGDSSQVNEKRLTAAEICLWDVATGKKLQQVAVVTTGHNLALSPDNKVLAEANSNGGPIRLWDVATGKQRSCCGTKKRGYEFRGLAFSPNGKMLAATIGHDGGVDSSVHLWDVESGKEITPCYDGHSGPVTSVAFSAGNREIVSCGADAVFRVWDSVTGRERLRWGQVADSWIRYPAIGAVATDGETAVSVENGRQPADTNTVTMRIIRRIGKEGKELCRFPVSSKAMHFFDGYLLCSSTNKKMLAWSAAGEENVHLLEMSTGKELCKIAGDRMAFSPDGQILAAGSNTKTGAVSLWDVRSGEICSIPPLEPDNLTKVRGLTFSPDMRVLAVINTDDQIQLWPLSASKAPGMRVGACKILDIAYDRDGAPASQRMIFPAMAFSPDGRMLAATDGYNVVHVWETATGMQRHEFKGHEREIVSLAFASDGRRLASGSRDASILVWDVTSGSIDKEGMLIPSHLTAQRLATLWDDLASANARLADRAIWSLASTGASTVSFLEKRLSFTAQKNDAKVVDEKTVAQWISDLDARPFVVRDKARRKLQAVGTPVEPQLRQALRGKPSAEKRATLRLVLGAIAEGQVKGFDKKPSSEDLRCIRAIEVLGHIATPAAHALLEKLAAGSQTAPQTLAAKAVLHGAHR